MPVKLVVWAYLGVGKQIQLDWRHSKVPRRLEERALVRIQIAQIRNRLASGDRNRFHI